MSSTTLRTSSTAQSSTSNTKQLVSWTPRPDAQPAVFLSEYATADALVHAYPPFKKAMRDRGIDPDDVYVDVWAPETRRRRPRRGRA